MHVHSAVIVVKQFIIMQVEVALTIMLTYVGLLVMVRRLGKV